MDEYFTYNKLIIECESFNICGCTFQMNIKGKIYTKCTNIFLFTFFLESSSFLHKNTNLLLGLNFNQGILFKAHITNQFVLISPRGRGGKVHPCAIFIIQLYKFYKFIFARHDTKFI